MRRSRQLRDPVDQPPRLMLGWIPAASSLVTVVGAGILDPTIRVMDQIVRDHVSARQGHLQGGESELRTGR
jgi:hypothetical protein